jgi:hypothetical protein
MPFKCVVKNAYCRPQFLSGRRCGDIPLCAPLRSQAQQLGRAVEAKSDPHRKKVGSKPVNATGHTRSSKDPRRGSHQVHQPEGSASPLPRLSNGRLAYAAGQAAV